MQKESGKCCISTIREQGKSNIIVRKAITVPFRMEVFVQFESYRLDVERSSHSKLTYIQGCRLSRGFRGANCGGARRNPWKTHQR